MKNHFDMIKKELVYLKKYQTKDEARAFFCSEDCNLLMQTGKNEQYGTKSKRRLFFAVSILIW
jgi:hypothetical protein